MASAWNDLANGPRWRGVVSFIRNWVGPIDSNEGLPVDQLDAILHRKRLTLPTAIREWYLLAAKWSQRGLNVWIRPVELTASEGIVWLLTDTEGINSWGVRVADLELDDPPVVSREKNNDIVSRSFSEFVAAMIVNDLLFDYRTEEPIELKRDSVGAEEMRYVASCCGDFFTDGPLESASVVMFAYPENGPVYGKSRTPEGRDMLQRSRKTSA